MKKPETKASLASLRDRLAASQYAANQREVVELLRGASKAVNPEWTVPRLGDPAGMNKSFSDGSVRVVLLAHQVLINPNGAYRIIESHPPQNVFFERESACGSPFLDPLANPPAAA